MARSDAFGNLNYGVMLAHWGVELETALKGANLEDGVVAEDVGVINDDLYRKYPDGCQGVE